MKTRITLKDIAKTLNLSPSTVSKALNNSQEISIQTRIRVQEYAELQNYKPNLTARNLQSKNTKTIGVIVPNILNPFFAKVFSGIENYAQSEGYAVMTFSSNESYSKEKKITEILNNGIVDGIILSIAQETQELNELKHLTRLLNENIPIVLFDRVTNELKCSQVIVDDEIASERAIDYLISTQCKNIAFVSGIDSLSVAQLRYNGYINSLEKNNIKLNENLLLRCHSENEFNNHIEKFISKNQHIDAFFAIDENSCTKVHKLLLQQNKKIPQEVCIIGFADGIWSRRLTPSLSTISQHGPEIGRKSAELLILELKTEGSIVFEPKTEVILTELRKRDSVRKIIS